MSPVTTITIDNPQALISAIKVLDQGGLVICPTETVYGALVDATNSQAVAKLLSYKRRPAGKAISIACASKKQAQNYVKINQQAKQIYRTMLPGPVTVISVSRKKVVGSLESERGTLGIRLSSHPFMQQLLKKFPHPVTATSANSSGKKTPYTIDDIINNLSKKQLDLIDLIIDAGRLPQRPPSLVIDTTTATPTCLRANWQMQKRLTSINTPVCTSNPKATQIYAKKIIKKYLSIIKETGLIITLDGDLGAGKTTFTQGIGQALGIKQTISSPSYTYLKEYPYQNKNGQGTLVHLDLWAVENEPMLKALSLETYQQKGNLLIIEWYEQFASQLNFNLPTIHVTITVDKNQPEKRQLYYYENFRH